MLLILSRESKVASRIIDVLSVEAQTHGTAQQVIREAQRTGAVSSVVIGEDIDFAEASAASEQLRVADPSIAVVLLRNRVDLGVTTQAMRAGVRSVLSASDIRGLVEQVAEQEQISQAIRARLEGRTLESSRGTTVLVYSAKGGVGKTTTSLNLAASLAQSSTDSVVVVDLDLQFGDVGVAVGKPDSTKSISDLGVDPQSVTLENIRKSLEKIKDNFFVLLAPSDPAAAGRVSSELVARVIEELASGFDWVVIDSPPAFTDEILTAFDHADVQVLVSTPDLASVKNLSVATATLERIGLDKTARCVILNRFDAKSGMDRGELSRAAQHIAHTSDVFVIPDYAPILKSSSRGYVAALGPRGEKTQKLYQDVVSLIGTVKADAGGS